MCIRDRINYYRALLDANPDEARRQRHDYNQHTLQQAGHYLGVEAENVILTEVPPYHWHWYFLVLATSRLMKS